jgi:hypothetical protein
VRRLIDATGSSIDDDGVAHYTRLLRDPRHVAGVLAMTANWDLQPLQQDLLHQAGPPAAPAGRPVRRHRAAGPGRTTGGAAGARADCTCLPGLGHLAHEEAPQRVADALVPLLAGAPDEAIPSSADPPPPPRGHTAHPSPIDAGDRMTELLIRNVRGQPVTACAARWSRQLGAEAADFDALAAATSSTPSPRPPSAAGRPAWA